MRSRGVGKRSRAAVALALALLLAAPARADRTQLKPGWNYFSVEDDIQIGRNAAREAEEKLPLVNDPAVDEYLTKLGQRLARRAPGHAFPYTFKAVNQGEINAFALPGGPIYIHRGTIETAENEAQLAGVLAHEISHIALRHGTNQVTKQMFTGLSFGLLSGLFGGGSAAEAAAQLGIQLGAQLTVMKFSRSAETQADLMGTQILFDTGYAPKAMAEFFAMLEAKQKHASLEWFASHPNPDNRQKHVEEEIAKLGPLAKSPRKDSEEFQAIKAHLKSLPPPPKRGERRRDAEAPGRPQSPSDRFNTYAGSGYSILYPDNWKVRQSGAAVLLAPPEGVHQKGIAYGVLIDVMEVGDESATLEQAAGKLVEKILRDNPGMRELGRERARLAGQRALVVNLNGPSPWPNEREADTLYAVRRPEGLFYLLFIVPERDQPAFDHAFAEMLSSLRFR